MIPEAELLRLCLLAYEAAVDPALWPAFLERYARALNGEVAMLHAHDYGGGRSELVATFGYDGRFQQSYHQHYSTKNLWRDRGRKLYRTGVVLLEEEICPRAVTLSSEFYNDYLKPLGVTRSFGPVVSRAEDRALTMPALRRENQEPFDEEDRRVAGLLLPHLARANLIRERLSVLDASEGVLDGLAFGVVFVTGEGRVVYVNPAAEAMIRRGDGLLLRGGMIGATCSRINSALRRAIRQAAAPEAVTDWPRPVEIEREPASRAYQALIAPVRRRLAAFRGMPSASVVVLITDPEAQAPPIPRLLEQLYGLTSREAEVASKLAEGRAVEQLADELGIRYETARTHLRRIFDKTGVTRQAELVSLLARLPQQRTRD